MVADLIDHLWAVDYCEGVPFAGPRLWANIEAQRVLPAWRSWRLPWAVAWVTHG